MLQTRNGLRAALAVLACLYATGVQAQGVQNIDTTQPILRTYPLTGTDDYFGYQVVLHQTSENVADRDAALDNARSAHLVNWQHHLYHEDIIMINNSTELDLFVSKGERIVYHCYKFGFCHRMYLKVVWLPLACSCIHNLHACKEAVHVLRNQKSASQGSLLNPNFLLPPSTNDAE